MPDKVNIIHFLNYSVDIDMTITEEQREIIYNALYGIVDRALTIEDKTILQACDKLGLMGNRDGRA